MPDYRTPGYTLKKLLRDHVLLLLPQLRNWICCSYYFTNSIVKGGGDAAGMFYLD